MVTLMPTDVTTAPSGLLGAPVHAGSAPQVHGFPGSVAGSGSLRGRVSAAVTSPETGRTTTGLAATGVTTTTGRTTEGNATTRKIARTGRLSNPPNGASG